MFGWTHVKQKGMTEMLIVCVCVYGHTDRAFSDFTGNFKLFNEWIMPGTLDAKKVIH